METSSTIDQRLRLCTLASFVSCIVLVASLNAAKNSLKLSVLESVAMQTASSSNDTANKEGTLNEKEEKCNIFDGKWVYDPKASPPYTSVNCPFLSDQVSCQRNGRPDNDYEKWSWEVKGCNIPRFNGTNMLERLRGKRVIIVGDSLNRNQWESLACLLYSAIPSSRALVDETSSTYKVFRAMDYSCSVEFYWSPFLVQLRVEQGTGSRILRLDKLSAAARKWRGADVMVFNTGHWWAHRGKLKAWDYFQYKGKLLEEMVIESAFKIAIRTWARWVDRYVDEAKTTVFFRSISPSHKGEQRCYNRTQPTLDESHVNAFPKPIRETVERTIASMKTPVRILNITRLSAYRRDAHPSLHARKKNSLMSTQQEPKSHADCSHWCLPGVPDTWNQLLYASLALYSTEGEDMCTSSCLSI